MPSARLVYLTCPTLPCAKRLATTLVEERLAACVHTFPRVRSTYRWQGKVEQVHEIPLLIKTSSRQTKALLRRIAIVHPYEIPGVIVLPVVGGHPPFLHWIIRETTPLKKQRRRLLT